METNKQKKEITGKTEDKKKNKTEHEVTLKVTLACDTLLDWYHFTKDGTTHFNGHYNAFR